MPTIHAVRRRNTMPSLRILSLIVFCLTLVLVPSGIITPVAEAAQPSQTPLGSLLADDGSLDLATGWSGSIDATGWTMSTAPDGSPRFQREGDTGTQTSGRTTLAAVPGDEKWDDRFGLPGAGYSVYAVAVYESDVYVGGYFSNVGGMPASYIAKWNGRSWSTLGRGTSGVVYAIAVSGNQVYVGGDFATAGTATVNSLALWNGSTWQAVGGGIWSGSSRGTVRALALTPGGLFVGGSFDKVGTTPAFGVAKWNNGWRTLGKGVGWYSPSDGSISSGTVYSITAAYPSMYIGGAFRNAVKGTTSIEANSIAVWNDTASTWSSLGRGIGTTYDNGTSVSSYGYVYAITISNGDIYVGGDFPFAGNATGGVNVNSIARWRNGWSALGQGVATNYGRGTVRALTMFGTRLIVGGTFTQAGGTLMSNVALWNNNAWTAMKQGAANEVYALGAAANDVFMGGYFSTAGTANVNNIARWNGSTWLPLGEGISTGTCCGSVSALAIDASGNVYAGGYFSAAGPMSAKSIAMWNGVRWSTLTTGIMDGSYSGTVNAIAVSGNNVYVGGDFSTVGTTSANNIAVWNRATSTWSRMGDGVNGPVYALSVNGTKLYVGGQFTGAGTTDAENVAQWNGTTWQKLGEGVDFSYGTVRALATYAGRYVIVGGDFSSIYMGEATITVNGLLMWDNASPADWYLPGYGVTSRCGSSDCSGDVYALALIGDDLFVGGDFDKAGKELTTTPYQDVVVAHSIARLNLPTNRWYSLGGDVVGGGDQEILALSAAGTDLYVGGNFATVANKTAHSVARWSTASASWSTLGAGMTGDYASSGWEADVNALATSGAAVYIGGDFLMAGDKPSHNFARWGTAPNAAANPGFEQAAGWTMDAAATRTTAYKRTGGNALRQSATTNTTSLVTQQITNLKGGVTYTASAWVAVPATTDKFQWYLEVQWRNASGNIGTPVIINRQIVPTNNSWVQLLGTLAAPAGTTNAVLRLRANDLAATVYVDDVVFTAETAPPAVAATAQGTPSQPLSQAGTLADQPRTRTAAEQRALDEAKQRDEQQQRAEAQAERQRQEQQAAQ